MIKTKEELQEYMYADEKRNKKKCSSVLVDIIRSCLEWNDESYYVCKYLGYLRKYEYYYNNRGLSISNNLLCKLYFSLMNRLSMRLGIHIMPNTVGKGLFIPHFAGGVYINAMRMGDNCTISSGVVIGNKNDIAKKAIIGNNVELCVGCKVIGNVKIGDNAVIAPNSVVIKDVPANSIVSGIPAKIIKMK